MKFIPFLLIIANLTACGGSDGSPIGSNDILLGTWKSNCYAEYGSFHQDQYIFNNNTYLLDRITYSDNKCNIQTGSTASYDGTYTIGLNVVASDGVEVTRMTMKQVDSTNKESDTSTIKFVFRIAGDGLSIGLFEEGYTPELNLKISYIKQSNDRQLVCTEEQVHGINVRVIDRQTEQAIACDANVIIKDGDYYQRLDNPQSMNCNDKRVFSGATERKGRYDIIVQKPGFRDWYQNNVVVTANRCHVNSIEMTAELQAN